MAKNERTSPRVATIASKALRNPKSSKITKTLAGAALTLAPDKPKPKRRKK